MTLSRPVARCYDCTEKSCLNVRLLHRSEALENEYRFHTLAESARSSNRDRFIDIQADPFRFQSATESSPS